MVDRAEILNEIKREVIGVDPSAQIILFGSQARGDVHEESDWDVLVITNDEVTRLYKNTVRKTLHKLELTLEISIGSLFVNRRKWQQPTAMPVYLEIKKDGILL